jgi:spore maturation protein SpmB
MNLQSQALRAALFLGNHLKESASISFGLLKVAVPAIIFTKILEELGCIHYIGIILEPVMKLVGLPGELGLVWATALLTTPYGGIGVLAALVPSLTLTAADLTVLCSLILIAHSLPIEQSITRKAGAGFLPMAAIRVFGALGYGMLLHAICNRFSIWQYPAATIFRQTPEHQSLAQWALNQCFNIFMVCLVIFAVLLAMRVLRALGVIRLCENLLKPVLPWLGMSHRAAPVTVVGMLLGIVYGGALIIRETTEGSMDSREIFNSLALMSLSHGLIEDTMIMMTLGAKLGGILWGRLVFSLLVIYVLVRVTGLLATPRTLKGD